MKPKLISTNILNDSRFGRLDDHSWRIAISLLLVCDDYGRLPDLNELSFRIRASEQDISEAIDKLVGSGLVSLLDGAYYIDTRHLKTYELLRMEWLLLREGLTAEVFERDGKVCRHCGSTHDLTIDHIIPLARFGTNDPGNLQVLCRSCNSRKGAR